MKQVKRSEVPEEYRKWHNRNRRADIIDFILSALLVIVSMLIGIVMIVKL